MATIQDARRADWFYRIVRPDSVKKLNLSVLSVLSVAGGKYSFEKFLSRSDCAFFRSEAPLM